MVTDKYFYAMLSRFILIILLVFTASNQLWSQNPFEIIPRLDNNPRSNTSLDSIASGIDLIERSVRSNPEEVSFEPVKIESTNPFEVSHIPLRKSKSTVILSPQELKKERKAYMDRNVPLFIIVLSLIIIAVTIGLKDNIITKALKASYNANYMKLIMSDAFSISLRTYLLLYALFFINAALAFSFIISKLSQPFGILTVLMIILGVYLVRHLSLWLLGYIFNGIRSQSSEYNFSIQLGNIVVGMLLLPVNILMIYGFPSAYKFFAVLFIIIFIISYALRALRSTKLTTGFLFSNRFHFFLYLCACEFGPILVFSKFTLGII